MRLTPSKERLRHKFPCDKTGHFTINCPNLASKKDILWKGILEDVFDDFLRFLYPDADKLFDFKKPITFLDKELEQLFPPEGDVFAPKVIDKLAKVHTHNGKEEWILVHVEVQGKYSKGFNKRMFEYFYRILDKYGRNITAWAIFTEGNNVKRPGVFEIDYLGTSLRYQYNVYKIAAQKDEELLASNNPFALATLVAKTAFAGSNNKSHEQILLEIKLQLARKLTAAKLSKAKIERLINFLSNYVSFETTETNNIFEQELKQLTKRISTMGINELLVERAKHYGRLEGKAEGKAEGEEVKGKVVVEKLILDFGFTDEQAATAASVSLDFVKKIRAELNKKNLKR